jgi:flagellar export protein FliJ
MAFKTRLDVVVRLRQRAEDAAKLALGRARADVARAEEALEQMKDRAKANDGQAGIAADWEVRQAARDRALAEIKKAEEALRQLRAREAAARKAYEAAWRELEAVRRVAEAKRQEMAREAGRKERKEMDEVAGLLHARKE